MKAISVSDDVFEVAGVLEITPEDLLAHALARYVEEELAACEQRLGRLYLEEHELRHKYKAGLTELSQQLEVLEEAEDFEELKVNDIPVLEAVSDTRRWEHLLERLAQEEKRLRKLQNLAKSYEIESIG